MSHRRGNLHRQTTSSLAWIEYPLTPGAHPHSLVSESEKSVFGRALCPRSQHAAALPDIDVAPPAPSPTPDETSPSDDRPPRPFPPEPSTTPGPASPFEPNWPQPITPTAGRA